MQKRNVLFVAHHLTVGGAQKSMVTALKAIDYQKNDVTLYVRKNRLDLLNEIDKRVTVVVNDDPTHYYRNTSSAWMLLRMKVCHIFKLREKEEKIQSKLAEHIRERMMERENNRYFRDKKFDVAITYIQGYTADLVAEAIDAERKYLFFHSSTDEAHEFHERTFPKYDGIIAVGEEIKKLLLESYPVCRDRIGVLKNYVDYEEVRKRAGQAILNVPKGKMILCSCGRLSPVKGFDLAVKAAKILKDNGESFLWYFVGDGPERSKLESMIRERGLEDCVVIAGMQENPYPWINACDIYVQPSYEEAYGLTIVEAQVLCKPVVSTATVGGKVLIPDGVNGFLTKINETAIAEAIAKLMHAPATREAMAENLGLIDYSEHYEQYKTAWKRLLEG